MAITMRVQLRRLGEYAHLWQDERTDLPWTDDELRALTWLESRYDVPDLHVILQRTVSSIEQRQQSTHGPNPIEPAAVTFRQSVMRAIAALAMSRERSSHKWTAEEDGVLAWLSTRYSIVDLQVILRRPAHRIEDRLIRLRIDHPGVEQERRERESAPTMKVRLLRMVLYLVAFLVLLALSLWLS
jgi:hypothetical protein